MIIIVGAQKSATSSLTSLFNSTYDVKFIKESTIFEIRNEQKFQESLLQLQNKYGDFSQLDKKINIGFCRPNLLCNELALKRIIKYFPKSVFIVVLRNPLDRTISSYYHYMRDGLIDVAPIDYGLKQIILYRDKVGRGREVIENSLYFNGINTLVQKEVNLNVFDFVNLVRNPNAELKNFTASYFCVKPRLKLKKLQASPSNLLEILKTRIGISGKNNISKKDFGNFKRNYKDAICFKEKALNNSTFDLLTNLLINDIFQIKYKIPTFKSVAEGWIESIYKNKKNYLHKYQVGRVYPPNPFEKTPCFLAPKQFAVLLVKGNSPSNLDYVSGFSRDDHPDSVSFVADPFVYEHEEKVYAFIESRYPSAGVIDVIAIENDKFHFLGNAIKEKFHLSYPNVFNANGSIYMLPESIASNSLRLYIAQEFPLKWDLVFSIEGQFIDPTYLYHLNKHWVFYKRNEELHLCELDIEKGVLYPHPSSPLDVSKRYNRPGGGFISFEDNIYRPSQRCENVYGECLDLHKVVKFTCDEYIEDTVMEPFLPRPSAFSNYKFSQRIHHISLLNKDIYYGCIDGRDLEGLYSAEYKKIFSKREINLFGIKSILKSFIILLSKK